MSLKKKLTLASAAAQIIAATAAGSNTKTVVGNLFQDIIDTAVLRAGTVAYYVEPVAGLDTNSGSLASPFKTYAHARAQVQHVPANVRCEIFLYADKTDENWETTWEGYDEEELWDMPETNGEFRIVGLETVQAFPDPEVSTHYVLDTYASRVFDFSTAAPGWTEGELSGLDLEVVESASGHAVGQKRTITWNTADTIIVGKHHAVTGSFTAPPDGAKLRIVRPAVKIKTSKKLGPESPVLENRSLKGGTGGMFSYSYWVRREGIVELENLEFAVPDGEICDVSFTGAWEFYGVHFTQDHSSRSFVFFDGASIRAGAYTGVEDVMRGGWGLSTRSRDFASNRTRPGFNFSQTEADVHLFGGPLYVRSGSHVFLRQSIMDQSGAGAFATVYLEESTIHTEGNTEVNMYMVSDKGTSTVQLQMEHGSLAYWYTPIQTVANCEFARVVGGLLYNRHGIVRPSGVTTGGEISAREKGTIAFIDDGATFGDAEVGLPGGPAANHDTRAAGAWNYTTDVITDGLGSSIYKFAA